MTADPWKCATCKKPYPVRVLARDCEKRHDDQEDE